MQIWLILRKQKKSGDRTTSVTNKKAVSLRWNSNTYIYNTLYNVLGSVAVVTIMKIYFSSWKQSKLCFTIFYHQICLTCNTSRTIHFIDIRLLWKSLLFKIMWMIFSMIGFLKKKFWPWSHAVYIVVPVHFWKLP